MDALFRQIRGVNDVVCGYAGGITIHPNYKEVCQGTSGHAEVVKIIFDDVTISYEKLLELFWLLHDPTTLNQQGADRGTQYRSIVIAQDDSQYNQAHDVRNRMQSYWQEPIVTEISPIVTFYDAESYHQNYFERNPYQGYCQVVIAPKIEKLRKEFFNSLRV